ncbi:PH domain-containing protein [Paludicola sp. MB14-C6]|uniref:PH domain-containing protein n=1 Tax=Paludihabitans sp. MB14-C6 TaxID=3070656 RepID=UPI0027DB7EEF|nr:PH domain-containing protein [Paludicola sp. MB14-C6]WMJ23949.1 PH domain-containing protein [Paludicola sp. MB14-C6]
MKFERLSITAAVMWEIITLAVTALILIVILFVLNPHTWLWYTSLWLLGALTIALTFIYVPFLYLNASFGINEDAIVYKKGVFFTSTQILYRERIVFVTVYNNPLTPLLHISTLVVSAAGGSMTIAFLNSKRAKELAVLLSKEKSSIA